jgi:glycosyl hydrolase family 43
MTEGGAPPAAVGGKGAGGATAGASSGGAGASSGGAGASSGGVIRNDVFWKDTAGNNIYSQGGGVLAVGRTYYWYGVNYAGAASYAANPTNQNSNTTFVAVTAYSSTDLATWKFEGNALTYASMAAKLTMTSSTWIGRVGAAYNAVTKKYVIVGQYLGTPDTQQFFASSDTPNGPFSVDGTQAVISNVTNGNCGDQAIFNDDDGQAYILCSSLSGRANIYVVPLRQADFLAAQPATRIYNGAGREGNAMFKYNGRYYACSSDLHGWNASHTYCISATNILGPYSAETVMGNTDLDFSHVTQTGLFLTVKGSTQSTVIFGGDRWSDFAGNGIGYNQWLPLTFDGVAPSLQSLSEWSINPSTGTWTVGPGNNYALNPSFEADRVATNPPAGWTTSAGADVTTTHSGNFAWQLTGASSVAQTRTDLPNGTYTLSVWARGSGTGTLQAKGFGGADLSVTLTGSATAWTQVKLSGIAISNGKCLIAAATSTGTISVDDFTLTKG